MYREEKTRYWILTIKTTIYRTFILSSKHLSIYIKKETILKGCQEPFCLEYYLEKAKEWHKIKNKDDKTTII